MAGRWVSFAVAALVVGCGSATVSRAPGSLYHPDVVAGQVAYTTPVVTASRVSYQDSHTGRQYHHSDKGRTRDALLRELRFLIKEHGLAWRPVGPRLDSAVTAALTGFHGTLDSFPPAVGQHLAATGADAVVVLYDARLVHEHSVGSDIPLPEAASYTNRVRKTLQFACAVIDVGENRRRFLARVAARERGDALTVVERGMKALFEKLFLEGGGGPRRSGPERNGASSESPPPRKTESSSCLHTERE